MKSKQFILAVGFAFLSATSLMSCDSKKENKAEEVQDQKEDVIEAQNEGDTAKVMEEQSELDSARKDYREAVRDSVKSANN
ncbi:MULTISPECIES: hypothetical protein [Spirosoma]|uniref:Lipoprotein n=1 Tax=Spirosoma liriopis TaxID=2937440 RepID=A0ABT0HH20_9BACT|nr:MULTISPECIES: hypothetical protein [Spirosoma]MCK8490895.1 hypothetical protein [Spirosoma liriopis]UHG90281.1 hypothetical protein LQ777_18755 [Spirosoma oryzicola]